MPELFSDIAQVVPRLVTEGLAATLIAFTGGAVLTVLVALVLGLAQHQGPTWMRVIARVVVEFFRGTSLVVQLFFLFYVIPTLTGFDLGSEGAAIVGLGLNYGAYGAEIVRGALNAVPRGQWETATALSMSWSVKMRRVILPQAWALMLPGFNNLLVMLVKGTAVVGLVLMADLTFEADRARRVFGTWPAFLSVLVIYFLIALVVSVVLRALERRAQRRLGLGRTEIAEAQVEAQRALSGGLVEADGGPPSEGSAQPAPPDPETPGSGEEVRR